jgi:hypothetical protein
MHSETTQGIKSTEWGTVLPEFPDDDTATLYPWHKWADGQIWRIQNPTNFGCSLKTMRNNLTNRAKRDGTKVKIRVSKTTKEIVFQFKKKDK